MTNRIKQWCLLLIAMITIPRVANAYPVEINGIYYNLINKVKEAEVAKNPYSYSENLEIPDKVVYENTEYTVTNIEKEAFSNNFSLKSVTIPNTISIIKTSTFMNCKNLTSISIPNSITSIEGGAFELCI